VRAVPDADLLAIELGLGEFTVTRDYDPPPAFSPFYGRVMPKDDVIAHTVSLVIDGHEHSLTSYLSKTIEEEWHEQVPRILKLDLLYRARLVSATGTYYACRHCHGLIEFLQSPHGSWWAHNIHPNDEHDAEPDERSIQLAVQNGQIEPGDE
jgi:hypothetical protein